MRLRDRLRDLGFGPGLTGPDSSWKLWEYSEDMPGGDEIRKKVLDVVNRVELAILCFSDETANTGWMSDEAAWCVQKIVDTTQELKHIIPVWVGPHPRDLRPHSIEDRNVLDAAEGTEEQLQRVVDNVIEKLAAEAPVAVPAALFAITQNQCDDLFAGWTKTPDEASQALQNLCLAMGMKDPPPLYDLFKARYGKKVEDFAPFNGTPGDAAVPVPPRQTLIDLIDEVVRTVNVARTTSAQNRQPPIYIRWVHDGLTGNVTAIRDLWDTRESLLIIDSISMLEPQIREVVRDLPRMDRSSVLWLPPYTQHTAKVTEAIELSIKPVKRLGDELRKIEQQPHRSIAFDASNPVAVRLWLLRTLAVVNGGIAPMDSNIDGIRAAGKARISLSTLRSTGLGG